MRTDSFSYRGMRIRYGLQEGAVDQFPLFMFNGIGQSIEVLTPLAKALPEIPALAFDVPGTGESDVPRRPLRYCEHAEIAAALLDHLEIQRINLFGVSWGGAMAQQFAVQHPERVERLVLAAAPLGNFMIPGKPGVYLRLLNFRRFWESDYMHKIAGHIYGGDVRKDPAAVDEFMELLRAPSRKGYLFQALSMAGWSALPLLPRIKVPTLILQGDDDPMIPNINARLMAHLIPDSRLEMLDCGHLFLLTRMKHVSPLIREFAYG